RRAAAMRVEERRWQAGSSLGIHASLLHQQDVDPAPRELVGERQACHAGTDDEYLGCSGRGRARIRSEGREVAGWRVHGRCPGRVATSTSAFPPGGPGTLRTSRPAAPSARRTAPATL